jgi:hypothetical protein
MRQSLARAADEWAQLGEEPPLWARSDRAAHRSDAERIAWRQRYAAEHAAKLEAEIASARPLEHAARAERAVIDQLVEERITVRMTAVRLDPLAYIVKEMGEAPSDPAKRREWETAARHIESYRLEHGIEDRDTTFGAEPTDPVARLEQQRATDTLRRTQQNLGLEEAHAIEQTIDMGIEL